MVKALHQITFAQPPDAAAQPLPARPPYDLAAYMRILVVYVNTVNTISVPSSTNPNLAFTVQ